MSHNTLANFQRTLFWMKHEHNHDLEYLDNMMIWEKDVFVDMVVKYNEEKTKG